MRARGIIVVRGTWNRSTKGSGGWPVWLVFDPFDRFVLVRGLSSVLLPSTLTYSRPCSPLHYPSSVRHPLFPSPDDPVCSLGLCLHLQGSIYLSPLGPRSSSSSPPLRPMSRYANDHQYQQQANQSPYSSPYNHHSASPGANQYAPSPSPYDPHPPSSSSRRSPQPQENLYSPQQTSAMSNGYGHQDSNYFPPRGQVSLSQDTRSPELKRAKGGQGSKRTSQADLAPSLAPLRRSPSAPSAHSQPQTQPSYYNSQHSLVDDHPLDPYNDQSSHGHGQADYGRPSYSQDHLISSAQNSQYSLPMSEIRPGQGGVPPLPSFTGSPQVQSGYGGSAVGSAYGYPQGNPRGPGGGGWAGSEMLRGAVQGVTTGWSAAREQMMKRRVSAIDQAQARATAGRGGIGFVSRRGIIERGERLAERS